MTSRSRFASTVLAVACLAVSPVNASAQTVIVDEDFEGYADQAALKAAWVPTSGNGSLAANAADVDAGYLIGCASCAPTVDPANYPNIQGQAADHIGSTANAPGQVNQFGGVINQGAGMNPAFQLNPTATQNVVLSADIFNGTSGNERMSVGLRNVGVVGTTVTTVNLLEMGQWNAATTDPTLPASPPPPPLPATNFAVRVNLFGPVSAPLVRQPDWQYFVLSPALDRTTDTDELTSLADIGAGWHTYTATISEDKVTFTIDLFRDGFKNVRDEAGVIVIGSGEPGVDGTLEFPVARHANGFNSVRFGGPSGLTSGGAGFMAFDTISLQVVEDVVPTDDADFDNDGDVDIDDFNTWTTTFGASATTTTGDATGDGKNDGLDFLAWQAQFDPPGGPAAAVPEPASAALAVLALTALGATRRRR